MGVIYGEMTKLFTTGFEYQAVERRGKEIGSEGENGKGAKRPTIDQDSDSETSTASSYRPHKRKSKSKSKSKSEKAKGKGKKEEEPEEQMTWEQVQHQVQVSHTLGTILTPSL